MTDHSTAYQKAQELAAALKNEAALIAFEQAFKEEPSNYKAVFGRGLMLQRLGEHTQAVLHASLDWQRVQELLSADENAA